MEHNIQKGEYAYSCTKCGMASGDGSGITGECSGKVENTEDTTAQPMQTEEQSMHGAGTIEGDTIVPAPFTLAFTPKPGHTFTDEDLAQNAEFAKDFYAQDFKEDDLPSGSESVTIKRA